MFFVIRKPSRREARSAARIVQQGGEKLTPKQILSSQFRVAVDENKKVVGVILPGGSNCFALNEQIERAIKKKIA